MDNADYIFQQRRPAASLNQIQCLRTDFVKL